MCVFTTPRFGHNQDINVSTEVTTNFIVEELSTFENLFNKSFDGVCHRLWWMILLNEQFSKNEGKVCLKCNSFRAS